MVHGTLISLDGGPSAASSSGVPASSSSAPIKGQQGEGMAILVDGFQSKSDRVQHYILSHFHSDHTAGLGKGFKHGKIYCTPLTADLIVHVTGVKRKYVVAVPYREVHWIGGEQDDHAASGVVQPKLCPTPAVKGMLNVGSGSTVAHDSTTDAAAKPESTSKGNRGHTFLVFLDANHCPGAAVMLIGSVRSRRAVLHCGDFRGTPSVAADVRQCLRRLASLAEIGYEVRVDTIYLDNTYCRPRWVFPSQLQVLRELRDYVRKELRENAGKRVLWFVGSYAIGKEKVAAVVAETVAEWFNRKSPKVTVKTARRWSIQELVQKHHPEFGYFGPLQVQPEGGRGAGSDGGVEQEKAPDDVWMVPLSEVRHDRLLRHLGLGPRTVHETEARPDFGKEGFLPENEYEDAPPLPEDLREIGSLAKGQQSENEELDDAEDAVADALIGGINGRVVAPPGPATTGKEVNNSNDLGRAEAEVIDLLESDADDEVSATGCARAGSGTEKLLVTSAAPDADPHPERRFYEGDARPSKRKQQTILKHAGKQRKIRRKGPTSSSRGEGTAVVDDQMKACSKPGQLAGSSSTGDEPAAPGPQLLPGGLLGEQAEQKYDLLIGFRPTGWAYRSPTTTVAPWISNNGKTKVVHMPYSEHSSFTELVGFVKSIQPRDVIPTVPDESQSASDIQNYFLECTDGSNDVNRIEYYMRRLGEEHQVVQSCASSAGMKPPARRGPRGDASSASQGSEHPSTPKKAQRGSWKQSPARCVGSIMEELDAPETIFSPAIHRGYGFYKRKAVGTGAAVRVLSGGGSGKDKKSLAAQTTSPENAHDLATKTLEDPPPQMPESLAGALYDGRDARLDVDAGPPRGFAQLLDEGASSGNATSRKPRQKIYRPESFELPVLAGGSVVGAPVVAAARQKHEAKGERVSKGRILLNGKSRKVTGQPMLQQSSLTSFLPSTTGSGSGAATGMKAAHGDGHQGETQNDNCGISTSTAAAFNKAGPSSSSSSSSASARAVKSETFEDGSVLWKTTDSKGNTHYRICNENRKVWDPEELGRHLLEMENIETASSSSAAAAARGQVRGNAGLEEVAVAKPKVEREAADGSAQEVVSLSSSSSGGRSSVGEQNNEVIELDSDSEQGAQSGNAHAVLVEEKVINVHEDEI